MYAGVHFINAHTHGLEHTHTHPPTHARTHTHTRTRIYTHTHIHYWHTCGTDASGGTETTTTNLIVEKY